MKEYNLIKLDTYIMDKTSKDYIFCITTNLARPYDDVYVVKITLRY